MGEKDRLRGFGRWGLILKLPNPLTPPSPLWGEGDNERCLRHFFLDIRPHYGYITILTPVKDMARRHTASWERGRCPRAGLQPAPGRLGYQSPGITTGTGGASLDWERRRRVTPVQTASQEAWPEAEPLGWNNSLRREPRWNAGKRARSVERSPRRKMGRYGACVCRASASVVFLYLSHPLG